MQANQQDGNPPAPTAGSAIMNRLREGAGVGAPPPNGQPAIVEPTPKELEVDVGGGVKRRVPVEDLVKTYVRKAEIDSSKEALDKRFAEMTDLESARALQARVSGLSPAQQRKVLELLHGESPADDGDEDDADARRVLPDSAQRSPEAVPPEVLKELATLRQAVTALATRENGRLKQEHEVTVSERVDALMGQFPVFTDPNAKKHAKPSIMDQVLANPGKNLEAVVQAAAASLQDFIRGREDAVREEVGVPRQMVKGPKGGPKGGDLTSGRLRALAQAAVRNGASRQ